MLIAILGDAYNTIQERYENNEKKELKDISDFFRTRLFRRKAKQEEEIPMTAYKEDQTEELLKKILKKIEDLETRK